MRQRLISHHSQRSQIFKGLVLLVLGGSALLQPLPVQALQLVDPPSSAALAGRVQLALESFRILDAYPDRTFQGQRPINRYELADALGRSMSYLQQRYGLKLEDDLRLGSVLQAYLKPQGDIPERHWAYASLERVVGYGLMPSAGLQFQGGARVSRYTLAQSLQLLLDWLQVTPIKMQSRSPVDVASDHWASRAVTTLVDAGIFELDPAGQFDGERAATRFELAETLVRLLQQVDLVAQQRPLEPKKEIPALRKGPTGRKPRHP